MGKVGQVGHVGQVGQVGQVGTGGTCGTCGRGVTGGIGGVHRGAEQTFDISADLLELSKTPVSVISAGVKSILDIPKTSPTSINFHITIRNRLSSTVVFNESL